MKKDVEVVAPVKAIVLEESMFECDSLFRKGIVIPALIWFIIIFMFFI